MTTDANSPGGNEDQTPAIEHTTSGGSRHRGLEHIAE